VRFTLTRVVAAARYPARMCRSIHPLFNVEPAPTDEDIHAAALQYVRKVSGTPKPSRANEEAFSRAVGEVAEATHRLIGVLVTTAPPRDRALEVARARLRASRRYGTMLPEGS